jgi:hypothetical protein
VSAAVFSRADQLWRVLLVLASVIFALSGPIHAIGQVDLVFYASLAGLTLGALAVLLALLGMYRERLARRRTK